MRGCCAWTTGECDEGEERQGARDTEHARIMTRRGSTAATSPRTESHGPEPQDRSGLPEPGRTEGPDDRCGLRKAEEPGCRPRP